MSSEKLVKKWKAMLSDKYFYRFPDELSLAEFTAFSEVAAESTTLQTLDIGGPYFYSPYFQQLGECVKTNKSIDTINFWAVSIARMDHYPCGCLPFCVTTTFEHEGFRHYCACLSVNKTMKRVKFGNCEFDAESLKDLSNLTESAIISLQEIEFFNCVMNDSQMMAFCERFALSSVIFSQCRAFNSGHFAAINALIRRNEHLKSFAYDSASLLDVGIVALCEALIVNTTIEKLKLSTIADYSSEKSMNPVFAMLNVNKHIKFLDLSWNAFQNEGYEKLLEMLHSNTTVETLNLSYCFQYHMDYLDRFFEEMKTNTSIKELNLGSHSSFKVATAIACSEMLKVNKTLKSLSLVSCSMGLESFQIILEGVKVNTALTKLDLSYNHVEGMGGASVVDLLSHNTTLLQLSIRGNDFDLETCQTVDNTLNKRNDSPVNVNANVFWDYKLV